MLRGISLHPCPGLRMKTTSAGKAEKRDFGTADLAKVVSLVSQGIYRKHGGRQRETTPIIIPIEPHEGIQLEIFRSK